MCHPKPTLLVAHLLFCNRKSQLKKAKEPPIQRTMTVQTFVKTCHDIPLTERRAAHNSTYKKLAVQW
jgi:hypothetical protein